MTVGSQAVICRSAMPMNYSYIYDVDPSFSHTSELVNASSLRQIYIKELTKNSFIEKDPFKKITMFKSIKYKWGGKSFKGIDCSALIQVFLNYNNRFCPRDAKDQVRYFKKNINLKKIKKNDIIY